MHTLWFTKGIVAASRRHRRSPHWATERRWLRGDGSSPSRNAIVGFPAEVCESN